MTSLMVWWSEFWLLIMRSRVQFPVLPWGFFLEGEDSHDDHGLVNLEKCWLRPLLLLHVHISQSTSSGQANCASWASQPQTSVTPWLQPGGETMKSRSDLWWHAIQNGTMVWKNVTPANCHRKSSWSRNPHTWQTDQPQQKSHALSLTIPHM
jgi:hypothetical protein